MKAVRVYAQVLVDVALAPGSGVDLGRMIRELSSFAGLIETSEQARKVFENPALSDSERQSTLKALVGKVDLGAVSERFLNLLLKRGRLELLPEIVREVELIEVERKGGVVGELVSAVELDAAAIESIAEALGKRLKKPVRLQQKTDAGLIAGMRVTVGGVTYDGSVKTKLEKLSDLN
jgi:F-type H+-transporting ATPase subunit delta